MWLTLTSPTPLPSSVCTGSSSGIAGELHLLLEPVAGDVRRDVGDHLLDRAADLVLRSSSGSSTSASTVSRMISGGSAGLRMMIALPVQAPPTASIAAAVVSVNSSMLARVPGPADFDAIDATISA